jgi:hypothetical protein
MPEFRRRLTSLGRAALWIAAAVQLAGLAACGGGGGYGGGGMNTSATPASKLFAADAGYPGIGSLVDPDPQPGMLAVDRFFYGGGLTTSVGSLALDTGNDRLYVGNGTSILVYDGASMASGIPSPARTITGFGTVSSLFIDGANNRLFVGDDAAGVTVFDSANTASGMATPSRSITGSFGSTFQIHGVAVDPTLGKDILYVSNTTLTPSVSQQITLFTASTANDPATVKATITPVDGMSSNLTIDGIALDSQHDRLYVAGPAPTVLVFDNASGLSGNQTATRTITLPGQIRSLAIDPVHDRLYAVELNGVAVYIVEGAAAASGTPATVKTISPPYGPFTGVAVNPA